MQRACESIVDPIVENVKQLIADSNPEYHDQFRRNMVLAGGGLYPWLGAPSSADSDMGDVNVHVVDDPVRLGAMGGSAWYGSSRRHVEEPHPASR